MQGLDQPVDGYFQLYTKESKRVPFWSHTSEMVFHSRVSIIVFCKLNTKFWKFQHNTIRVAIPLNTQLSHISQQNGVSGSGSILDAVCPEFLSRLPLKCISVVCPFKTIICVAAVRPVCNPLTPTAVRTTCSTVPALFISLSSRRFRLSLTSIGNKAV